MPDMYEGLSSVSDITWTPGHCQSTETRNAVEALFGKQYLTVLLVIKISSKCRDGKSISISLTDTVDDYLLLQ